MRTRPLHSSLGSLLSVAMVGCNAIVGTEAVQYRNEVASASPSAAPACESSRHTQELNGDGGAPSTIRAQCATVVIDETTCAVDPADVGLDLGLDGHGWAVTVNAMSCFGGAILVIQGVDDAPYPQTAVQPFLSETSAWLATNEDATDDAGVAGSLPFDGETVGELSAAIQGRPAPDVRELAPDVPDGLATAIARMLEKDVRRRFANVFELASEIAPYGLDAAAPKRIETILQSSVEAAPATHAGLVQLSSEATSSNVTGRAESTVTNAAIGRDDSTMGTATVSSQAVSTIAAPSRVTRRGVAGVAGAALLVAGALALNRHEPSKSPARGVSGTSETAARAPTPNAAVSMPPPARCHLRA